MSYRDLSKPSHKLAEIGHDLDLMKFCGSCTQDCKASVPTCVNTRNTRKTSKNTFYQYTSKKGSSESTCVFFISEFPSSFFSKFAQFVQSLRANLKCFGQVIFKNQNAALLLCFSIEVPRGVKTL